MQDRAEPGGTGFCAVAIADDVTGTLEECPVPPCRELAVLRGKAECLLGKKGDCWVYDFGTNIAGTVRFNLPPLVPGSRLKVRLAETITKEGFLDPRSGGSSATHHAPEYVYIAPAKPAKAEWTPGFSYTSFRYAEISGFEPYPERARDWGSASPLWRAAAVIVPYELYMRTGNPEPFRKCFPAAECAMRLFDSDARNGLVRKGLGDWIPAAGNRFKMPVAHSSSLCWIDCAEKMDFMIRRLGLKSSRDYAGIARRVRKRFIEEFYCIADG